MSLAAFFRTEGMSFEHVRRRWLMLVMVLYVGAAILTPGIIHFDEQFQMIEMMSVKLGITHAAAMPWEFQEHARPWMQPMFYYGIARVGQLFGVNNPYDVVRLCRLVSAIIGWLSIVSLSSVIPLLIGHRTKQMWALGAVLFYFSFPMLHARTSSENISASLLVFAFSFLVRKLGSADPRPNSAQSLPTATVITVGALLGVAYTLRFQNPFMILGMGLWCLIVARVRIGQLIHMGLVFLVVVALGIIIDWWGYGVWTFSPWNYLKIVLLQDKHSTFGVSPWWWYAERMLTDRVPIGLCIFLATVAFCWTQRRHLLTWMVLPFLVLNSFLGHKEFRFLIPFYYFAPLLVLMAIPDEWYSPHGLLRRWYARLAVIGLVLVNLEGLVSMSTKPITGDWLVGEFLSKRIGSPIALSGAQGEDPFNYGGMDMPFYRPTGYSYKVESVLEFLSESGSENGPQRLYYENVRGVKALNMGLVGNCTLIYANTARRVVGESANLSDWVVKALKTTTLRSIYSCHGSKRV